MTHLVITLQIHLRVWRSYHFLMSSAIKTPTDTRLIKWPTRKMQLCRIIYYSIVTWLLDMFRTILWTQPWQQPTIYVNKTRSCNYSLDAPDDERYYHYRSKHVEQPSNKGIINYPTQLHLVGHFIRIVLWCTEPWMSKIPWTRPPIMLHWWAQNWNYKTFNETVLQFPSVHPSFIHSFIPLPCAECDDSLPFSEASSIPLRYVIFPATLLHQLFFHPLLPHLAIYFLVYLSILLFPNLYIYHSFGNSVFFHSLYMPKPT